MLGSLLQDGMEITNDAAGADVVIVNTCSFIDAAQEESVDTILESAALREVKQRGQALVVSGCLPQRFRDELPKLLPEVDAFMGIDQVAQVSGIVRQALAHRAEKQGSNPESKGQGPRVKAEGPRSKVQSPKSEGQGPKSRRQIVERLAELDGDGSSTTRDSDRNLDHAGRTRRVEVGTLLSASGSSPSAPLAAAPLVRVNLRPSYVPDFATPRFRLTPRHFAYVKIAEGCNHPCSFCTIPRMRGSHRSRLQNDIVAEAGQLIAEGVRELNLISQDSTYYGLDLRPFRNGSIASPAKFTAAAQALPEDATTLCTLLRALNALPGDFWIRLLYTHPAHWTDELIQTIAECPKVARYVDMPLQHIHNNMLERMRRETSQQYIVDLIPRIRARLPGIAVRTTFIVGFPGETEACFETLLRFIRETKFERLGIFTFSQEEGTRAAKMQQQIPNGVKKRRRQLAMTEQLKVARQVSQSYVGREIQVLVEREAQAVELLNAKVSSWEHGLVRGKDRHLTLPPGRFLIARGEADAPDIDGRVYVRGDLSPGDFARVRVLGHTDYDLIGQSA